MVLRLPQTRTLPVLDSGPALFIPGFPGGASGKNPPTSARDERDAGSILGRKDPPEEGMATHSSMLAWRIPWMEELGWLRSIGSQRVVHS